ncbi:hypothetical protein HBH70_072640 [Parastagonospora nodorum]|nr:hypothetical protein HBH53_183120 [Parastagonospora nodorum]KAH3964115.1 hypothetical protein HBH51_162710 [Parastagonospora nodorum]KAH4053465.1 hypothetical protein HBH49_084060 [Parastagonospora nodorum]KAH4067408.1 hypothetical protein HBH50_139840 [Parastagonospora nodorum]KAH4077717.1 hypothetical protein HBH48_238710 [Parastagonospora nodorum]
MEKAGSILVRFYEVTNFRPAPPEQNFLALPDHDTLPKKVLKGASLSHLTRFEFLDEAQLRHLLIQQQFRLTTSGTTAQQRGEDVLRLPRWQAKPPFCGDVLKTLDLQPRTGLSKQLMKAKNDAASIIKKEEDIEDHD